MRKYNFKTKRTIMIILVLFAVFIIIFSLFLKRGIDVAKTAYLIDEGSVLFDRNNDQITTQKTAKIKMKWAGNYYLTDNDNSYNLGTHSTVYNSNNGDISLYGKFYEVNKKGKVKVIKDENKLKSSVNSKFYKLADRKYLIVDRTIESTNSSIVTSNYLLVYLDKSGNATLLNDKISLKTIKPTVLRTSSYTFDIANEKINYGEDDIDLKKIIGSTNEYDEKTYNLNAENNKNDTENDNYGNGTGSGGGNGTGNGTNNNGSNTTNNGTNNGNNGNNNQTQNSSATGNTKNSNSTYNNNYDSNVSDSAVDEIIKATKNTSVIRVTPGINNISIDYVVYDPDNDYKSVFIEVENTSTLQKNIVYLQKNNTNIVISELTPNVFYNLTFKYSYTEGGKQKEYTFDKTGVYTKIPEMTISITKVVDNKVYYTIDLDKNYTITGGTLHLLLNGQVVATNNLSSLGNTSFIGGNNQYFNISSLKLNRNDTNIFTAKLVTISFNTFTVNPDITCKFRY